MTGVLQDQTSRERVIQSLASMSSSQIVSATALHHKSLKPVSASAPSSSASAAGATVRQPGGTPHANYQNHNGCLANTVYSPVVYHTSKSLSVCPLSSVSYVHTEWLAKWRYVIHNSIHAAYTIAKNPLTPTVVIRLCYKASCARPG